MHQNSGFLPRRAAGPRASSTNPCLEPLEPRRLLSAAAVVGRYVFYNNSSYDGGRAAADRADDAAVAPDKEALVPGGTPSSANVTSYSRGINGVIIDVNDLPPGAAALTAADFTFRSVHSADGQELAGAAAPPPASVTVRRGAGAYGSDRITLAWPDYAAAAAEAALANGWLEVTIRANPHTGLAAPDVFYFGNLIGETGDGTSPFRVTAADLGAIKKALNSDATVSSRYDFNRDGKVTALDLGLAKANLNRGLPPLAPVGGATPAAGPAPFSAERFEADRDTVLRPAEDLL